MVKNLRSIEWNYNNTLNNNIKIFYIDLFFFLFCFYFNLVNNSYPLDLFFTPSTTQLTKPFFTSKYSS